MVDKNKLEYSALLTYIKSHLKDYEYEVKRVIKLMYERRYNLLTASVELYDVITDAIEDFCRDNNVNYDSFDVYSTYGKDIDDIFFDTMYIDF